MPDWPVIVVSGLGSSTQDLLQAALVDFDVSAIHESSASDWRVFFRASEARDRALHTLRVDFPALIFAPLEVADDDWAARSQASLRAVRVGNIIVAPPWDVPVVVVVQPSMGFGTGHHATTRLCLSALQSTVKRGHTVVDVGTGSGVLAIASSLLGAGNVIAFDDDPDAVQAARENLELNPEARVTLRHADLLTSEGAWADIVVANLTGALLIAAAERLQQLVGPQGRLVLSGFMSHEAPAVLSAYSSHVVEQRSEEEGWLCVTLSS